MSTIRCSLGLRAFGSCSDVTLLPRQMKHSRQGALSLHSWNWAALSYSLECDVKKYLCYNGCDCEDEESCQAIHGPSCKCKRQGSSDLFELSFQKETLSERWQPQRGRSGQGAPCRWEQPPNVAKSQVGMESQPSEHLAWL